MASIQAEYVKLENRLVLLAWLNQLFGYANNRELLADAVQAGEGFDPYGRSYVYHRLAGRGDKLKLSLADLGRYDEHVREDLAAVNRGRAQPITLRYFQHLSLLYTEAFLEWRFQRPEELLHELNLFVQQRNNRKAPGDVPEPVFMMADLNKVAYWMATGSGKTLIFHFNYRQFLRYNREPLDNILLITPNEGLSEQHLEEMAASGIPAERFNLEESGLGLSTRNAVRVLEITKLVEQKRGGGVSVPVEAFQGNNLIFVDEGHKGSGGEVWRGYRDALGATGFTFEYSATFGQALTAARNDELTAEYGKSIVFDYSYRYFHGDGYGKDFDILNLREETTEDKTHLLLLGNLLSFYEQLRCFREQAVPLRPYNLDKPLWVFVGSSVNAVYSENRRRRSDVLTVARFLHRFLENRQGWALKSIARLIEGQSGLLDPVGRDIFAGRFQYLQGRGPDAQAIYRDVLSMVFHAAAAGGLRLCDIRGQTGELGLKVSGSDAYFGLIYIGDTSTFKRLVEKDRSGIALEDDVMSDSLFAGINQPEAAINVLIGAKKFMEGWNSWRVSNMGLLNIGRAEGSQIIQLFGRGVRLRGRDMSLKRSSTLDGEHPAHIRLLETLNIFAVRANYMAQFREYLEREGLETEGYVALPLAIQPSRAFLRGRLWMPRLLEGRHFAEECSVLLAPDAAARVTVDLSLKMEALRSSGRGVATMAISAGQEQVIPEKSLALVDWRAAYLELLQFKEQKGFHNLIIQPEVLRQLLEADSPRLYRLVADEALVRPGSFAEVPLLQEAIVSILRKYVEKYYRVCQQRWDTEHMVYRPLDEDDPNFQDYVVRVPRSAAGLLAAVKQLIDEAKAIYEQDTQDLPNIHFDRHLYQPLLVQRGETVRCDPPGLVESEERFVRALRDYVRRGADGLLAGKQLFLLRNLSRGKGLRFFENEGFYPDFIVWIKSGHRQRIVFVEPHGLRHEKTYWSDDKAQLHERLAELSKAWGMEGGAEQVLLDSYIISATPYDELRDYYGDGHWTREQFAQAHILFFDGPNYCARILGG